MSATRHPIASPALASALGLALAALLFFSLSGCGGGGDDVDTTAPITVPAVLATGQSTTQAGDAHTGAAVLVLPLMGPVVDMAQAGTVQVHITGVVRLQAHYSAVAEAAIALVQPVAGSPSAVAAAISVAAVTPLAIADYVVNVNLPAGRTQLTASVTVHARDANALATGAMGRAEVVGDWVVLQPARGAQ